jgi:hypothetical protein
LTSGTRPATLDSRAAARHASRYREIPQGDITMSGELTALLLKALRSLSPEEREQVVAELLAARLEAPEVQSAEVLPLPPPAAPPAMHSKGAHLFALRQSLALGAAGPWQTVPVRLPVELHDRLKHWCQANNFTMAVVLRGLVARFLDQYGERA